MAYRLSLFEAEQALVMPAQIEAAVAALAKATGISWINLDCTLGVSKRLFRELILVGAEHYLFESLSGGDQPAMAGA